jgi:FkbM family methyltransferase
MKQSYVGYVVERIRRWLLRNLVPEALWPRHVLLDGVSIPVRGMPFSFGVKRILCDGTYENSERVLLNRVIRENDVVLEFGGSIGILATIAADKVGRAGMVISVEAADRLASQTAARLANRANVQILAGLGFPVAEAPERCRQSVFRDTGNSLGGRICSEETIDPNSTPHQIYDINRIMREYGVQPRILLVDIEGAESVVLEPLATIPSCIVHIIIELHPGLYGRATEQSIVEAICRFGYVVAEEVRHVYLFTRSPTN